MEILQSLPWWPLLLATILAFAESALGLGVIFPGEVAITAWRQAWTAQTVSSPSWPSPSAPPPATTRATS